jgi:hypothetical protein
VKVVQVIVVCTALVVGYSTANAQFVKGNEAVKVMADGSKKVETPPLPTASLAAPCPAEKAGCAGSGWRMVETVAGLRECTEIYARPSTCRVSTYGTEKRTRLWIVKTGGQWMQCQRPDLKSKCVSTKSLPFSEVQ